MRKQIALAIIMLNCFVFEAHAQEWLWAKRSIEDSLGVGEGFAIASDRHGNAYAAGWYGGTISFDGLSVSSLGLSDLFITKYSPSGQVLWVVTSTCSLSVLVNRIAVDSFQNSYVIGDYAGWIAFGTDTISGLGSSNNFFIAKFDSSGHFLWAKTSIAHQSGFSSTHGNDIVADAEGNAFVVGSFNCDTISFDSHNLVRLGISNVFIVKYDATGGVVWATSTQGDGIALSIAMDTWGSAYISGAGGWNQFVIGNDTLSGGQNAYFAKFTEDGNFLWVKNFPGSAIAKCIKSGAYGDIYLSGHFYADSFSMGPVTLYENAGGSLFIAKFDNSGNLLWAKNGGGSGNACVFFSAAVDAPGNFYLTGKVTTPAISFDQITIANITGPDPMFLVKYDASGNALCAVVLSSGGDDQNDVAIDFGEDSKYVYVCGDFLSDPFIIGTDTFGLTGGEDVFVAKFSCDVTGIFETEKEQSIHLFPNPAQSQLIIDLPLQQSNPTIHVFDAQGRIINLPNAFQTNRALLNTQNLPDGFYLLQITNRQTGRIDFAKFVKQQ